MGLRLVKVWQQQEHEVVNGPSGLTVRIAKRASRWHVVIRHGSVELLDQEVPTVDFGREVIREYLTPSTREPRYLDYTAHNYIGWNRQHYAA